MWVNQRIRRAEAPRLMMLVPTDILDVVPGINLVARATLFDADMLLTGHPLRDHLEMHHIMAWWRLVALDALS